MNPRQKYFACQPESGAKSWNLDPSPGACRGAVGFAASRWARACYVSRWRYEGVTRERYATSSRGRSADLSVLVAAQSPGVAALHFDHHLDRLGTVLGVTSWWLADPEVG